MYINLIAKIMKILMFLSKIYNLFSYGNFNFLDFDIA